MLWILYAILILIVGINIKHIIDKDAVLSIVSILLTYVIATFISNIFVFISIIFISLCYLRIFYIKNKQWFHPTIKLINNIDNKFKLSKMKIFKSIIYHIDDIIIKLYPCISSEKIYVSESDNIDKNVLLIKEIKNKRIMPYRIRIKEKNETY